MLSEVVHGLCDRPSLEQIGKMGGEQLRLQGVRMVEIHFDPRLERKVGEIAVVGVVLDEGGTTLLDLADQRSCDRGLAGAGSAGDADDQRGPCRGPGIDQNRARLIHVKLNLSSRSISAPGDSGGLVTPPFPRQWGDPALTASVRDARKGGCVRPGSSRGEEMTRGPAGWYLGPNTMQIRAYISEMLLLGAARHRGQRAGCRWPNRPWRAWSDDWRCRGGE